MDQLARDEIHFSVYSLLWDRDSLVLLLGERGNLYPWPLDLLLLCMCYVRMYFVMQNVYMQPNIDIFGSIAANILNSDSTTAKLYEVVSDNETEEL